MNEPIPGVSRRTRRNWIGPLLGTGLLLLLGTAAALRLLSSAGQPTQPLLSRIREKTLLHQLRPDAKGLSPSLSPLVSPYLGRRYEDLVRSAQSLPSPLPIEEILVGNSLALQGKWDQAESHYEKISAGPFRADAQANLALALLNSNRWDEAFAPALEALSEDAKRESLSDRAGDLGTLGTLAFRQGDLVKAQGAHESALQLAISAKDSWREAAERLSLGSLLFVQGRADAALEQQREALRLFQAIDEPLGQVQALTAMGLAYKESAQPASALDSFREAQRLSHRIGDRESEGTAWMNIALLEEDAGRYDTALDAGREALDLAGDAPIQRAVVLGTLAMIEKSAGKLPEAIRALEEARSLFRAAGASQQLHGVELQLKALKDQSASSP